MRQVIDSIKLRPKICVWEITSRCNLRCLHCASDFGGVRLRGNELSITDALRVCKELKELGCEKVVLSGGEALLRKDWEEIARELVSLEIHVALISNGFVINQHMAERIKATSISRVALSLDGMEATHNYVRDNQISFARVMQACTFLRSVELPVNMVSHVNLMNLSELPEMEELVISCGVEVWRIQLGSPLGQLSRHPELIVPSTDLPAIADYIVAAKRRGRITISVGDNVGYFSHHEFELRSTAARGHLNFWCGCSAGCLTIGIESDGNVKGCLSLQSDEFVEGNVRLESLREIWEKEGNFSYTRDFCLEDLHGHCLNCEYGEVCRGGCMFMAYGATGSVHDNPYCLYRILSDQKQPASSSLS